MRKFVIEVPHSKEECVQALDELRARPESRDKFFYGCHAGDHRAWAIVDAGSESEALELVPSNQRSKARIVPVEALTPEEILETHT